MAFGLLGKELHEVCFLMQLVDLDLQCDAVFCFVTVVSVEVASRTRVPERIGCFHLLRPLDLLAHLPQIIDPLWPSDRDVTDVWPPGHCHPFCPLDRPVLLSTPVSIPGVPGWPLRGFLVSLGSV